MSGDLQHFISITLYILCYGVIFSNSRTSTLWKLNSDKTKIIEASPFHQVLSFDTDNQASYPYEDDPIFNIITSTVHLGETWVKQKVEYYCSNCQLKNNKNKTNVYQDEEVLDCGKPVNFTYYDNLVGILNRKRHPSVPEPRAALVFIKKPPKTKNGFLEFDVDALERRLKKAKREKPKSVQLYNQIGNFWRIKGDAEKAIECFRRALAVSPHNAEVLLSLARIMFALQYLDDAIFLTRRSLEVQPPDKGAWQQYFTLGEILKAYGHYQEASIHLRHTLELKPGFEPAQLALKEMEGMPAATIHVYTLVIIVCLVFGVMLVILSSVDVTETECCISDIKVQKHFNKAMAMRSLRGLGMPKARKKVVS